MRHEIEGTVHPLRDGARGCAVVRQLAHHERIRTTSASSRRTTRSIVGAPTSSSRGQRTELVEGIKPRERLGSVGWRTVTWARRGCRVAVEIGISLIPTARDVVRSEHNGCSCATSSRSPTCTHPGRHDVTNRSEQRALEKAGFVAEGVLRSAQHRRGSYHDLVIYAVVRE